MFVSHTSFFTDDFWRVALRRRTRLFFFWLRSPILRNIEFLREWDPDRTPDFYTLDTQRDLIEKDLLQTEAGLLVKLRICSPFTVVRESGRKQRNAANSGT